MKKKILLGSILIPAVAFMILFEVFPVIYGLGVSLFDYNPANVHNEFVGLDNYRRMLQDNTFWMAVKNTFIFGIGAVILNITITLFLAKIICILPSKRWKTLFRTILFLPCVAPGVGTAMVWKYGFLSTEAGVLNNFLGLFGVPPINWALTTTPLFIIIIVYTLWADIGFNVVLFSAGLEGLPKEFAESAALEGANSLQVFLSIDLPLMGRTFAFVTIMTMADYFKMFAQFHIFAADGGLNDSAMVLTNYIYKTSFSRFDMGYGAALSFALFVIVFTVALIQNRMMRVDWSYE